MKKLLLVLLATLLIIGGFASEVKAEGERFKVIAEIVAPEADKPEEIKLTITAEGLLGEKNFSLKKVDGYQVTMKGQSGVNYQIKPEPIEGFSYDVRRVEEGVYKVILQKEGYDPNAVEEEVEETPVETPVQQQIELPPTGEKSDPFIGISFGLMALALIVLTKTKC